MADPETLLAPQDRQILVETFAQLTGDVRLRLERRAVSRIYVPGQEQAPDIGGELATLLREIAATSPRLQLTVDEVTGDHLPRTTFSSTRTKGVLRFVGLPAGHEMATLVATIMDLGVEGEIMPEAVATRLAALDKPVHVQVFVTPSCQYCPQMARVALQLAMVSDKITTDVVEIEEFPDLAAKYQVRGVPHTVINETETMLGAGAPMDLVALVEKVGKAPSIILA